MAGLIRDDDIALVRERARIDEVVSAYVTLKHAGGGSQKGLCPFHDEKSPVVQRQPEPRILPLFRLRRGRRRHRLPDEDRRPRLLRGGRAARRQVRRPAALPGGHGDRPAKRDSQPAARGCSRRTRSRRPTTPSSSPRPTAQAGPAVPRPSAASTRTPPRRFGIGFAPRGGDDLYKYLRQKGFQDAEIVTGGLVGQGHRGHYDRFRGRLLWPIRETNGDVIGFGARRIFDDDRIEAKYLNTPETPIYKKSHVLYGIDLARRDIARASQAVVVEGYTDVMACHLAGVPTAVATCGTAFGEDHGRVLRRLLQDHDEFRGEVIFTFDGDAAGQKAALRAFEGDQNFAGQTYVAVEPTGLDPCDLRLQQGDAAVRELVARRIPLYRFVLGNVVRPLRPRPRRRPRRRGARGRQAGLRDPRPVQGRGVLPRARRHGRRRRRARPGPRCAARSDAGPTSDAPRSPGVGADRPRSPPRRTLPDLRDPRFALERETLKLVVQHPEAVGRMAKDVDADDFTHPTYRAVWEAVVGVRRPADAPGGEVWVAKLRDSVADPALVVRPCPPSPSSRCCRARSRPRRTSRRTSSGCRRSPRCAGSPTSSPSCSGPTRSSTPREYNRMFGELVALEQHRRTLREKAIGGDV